MKFRGTDMNIFSDQLLSEAEEAITDIFFDFGLRYDNEQVKYDSRAKNVKVPMGGDPFIYQMTVNYNHYATGKITTAATNGNDYFWNPHFVLALSPLALRMIIFHEATHAIFNHVDRRGGRDPRLWNLAVDYVTNYYIVEDLKHRSETTRDCDRRVYTDPTLMIELGNFITLKDFEKIYQDPKLLEKMLADIEDLKSKKKKRVDLYEKALSEKRQLTDAENKKLIEEIKKRHVYTPNAKEKTGFFIDPNLPEDLRTPEQIYDYLFSKLPKCPSCGKVGMVHPKNKQPNQKNQNQQNQQNAGNQQGQQQKNQQKQAGQQGNQGQQGSQGSGNPGGSSGAGNAGKGSKSAQGSSGSPGANSQGEGGDEEGDGEGENEGHSHSHNGKPCDHDHGQKASGKGQSKNSCDDAEMEDETQAGQKSKGKKGQKGSKSDCGDGDGDDLEDENAAGQKGDSSSGDGDGESDGEGDSCGSGGGKGEAEGDFGCDDCQGSADILGIGDLVDEHMDSEVDQQEMAERLSEAIKQSSKMAGHVPSGMEGELGELVKPVLTFKDAIRLTQKRAKDGGKKTDYTRFKKRPLMSGSFIPKRKEFIFKAAILVDTSGSMSDQDIVNGVSQLQNMTELNNGVIIPADATIYWEDAVKINGVKAEELKRFKVVGRGGTMFNQFFTDYKENVGEQDLLIVITDGYLYDEVMEDPHVPVIWIVTNNHSRFKPGFGKTFELNI